MRRNELSILSFQQFADLKGRNGMQKKRMENKRTQIKPPFHFITTLNVKR